MPVFPDPWNKSGPHRVSVNSFGYGGSNAHAILEEACSYLSARGLDKWQIRPSKASWRREIRNNISPYTSSSIRQRIFLISGFDEDSCKAQVQSIGGYLARNESVADNELLDDVAYTLNERRSRFMWKTAVTGSSVQDLAGSLTSDSKPRIFLKKPTLAFVFTGQGAQWPGMGKELLEAFPVFLDSVSKFDSLLADIGAPFKVQGM